MKTITFYSYKGGVGRSLALSNIAVRLAEFNKRVCILDFDLDAPGLQFKFRNFTDLNKVKIESGIVDYIHSFLSKERTDDSIKKYSVELLPKNQTYESIHLIPAGDIESDNYWLKLNSLNWKEFFYSEKSVGVEFFLDLKYKIQEEFKPDYLLIDSKTGITDTSGISLRLLADEVVVLCANNEENIFGSKKIIKNLLNPNLSFFDKVIKVYMVLTRLPFTEKDRVKETQTISNLKRQMDSEIPNNNIDIMVIHSDRRLEEKETPLIGYEFEDNGVSISDDYLKLFDRLTENDLKLEEKERFKNVRIAEREFQKAMQEKNPTKRMEYLNSAIQHDKTNPLFYWERCIIYFDERKIEEVKFDIQTLYSLDPFSIYAMYAESHLLLTIYKQYDEALKVCDKALNVAPDNVFFMNRKAMILKQKQDFVGAEKILSHILNYLNPEDDITLNARADLYRIMGKVEQAHKDIRKAIELVPSNPVYLATLAEIYSVEGKHEEFYLHFTLALEKELTIEMIETAMEVYNKYINDSRFISILNKYNIDIGDLTI